MQFSHGYQERVDQETWNLLKESYESFQHKKKREPLIPKIIHQIWLGGEPPENCQQLIRKLKKLHPHWEHRLWREDQIDFELENRELFDQATNLAQKSDILRYEILNKYGGIYLDLDFLILKPFEELLGCDFFAGIMYDREPNLGNSIIGSSPKNPLIQELVHFHHGILGSNAMDIIDSTGPYHVTRIFLKHILTMDTIVAFPNSYFYPFPNFPRDRILGEKANSYFQANTICAHLWHCSWMKKKSPESFFRRLKNKIKSLYLI
ncbi:MAG: glycosyltransferase family 32 protein [Chthoniobacterales bacterium]